MSHTTIPLESRHPVEPAATLRIGQVAERSGCSAETIRHYEKLGLLPRPLRHANGYRYYRQSDVERLGFIRHGRELGLELSTIRELLSLADHPEASCAGADEIARHHLQGLEARIQKLQALADELRGMVTQCQGERVAECRIIESLFHAPELPQAPVRSAQ